jgi:hypothetical protein
VNGGQVRTKSEHCLDDDQLFMSLLSPSEATLHDAYCRRPSFQIPLMASVGGAQLAAFCSFDAAAGQLMAFGTAEGINATLQHMQLATTWSLLDVSDSVARATVSDSFNLGTVSAAIPLALVPRYPAV